MTDPGKSKAELEELDKKLEEHLSGKFGEVRVLSDPIDGDYWFKATVAQVEDKT